MGVELEVAGLLAVDVGVLVDVVAGLGVIGFIVEVVEAVVFLSLNCSERDSEGG